MVRGWVIGVADGQGGTQQLLVLLTDGRRVVVRRSPERESADLRAAVVERLRPRQPGTRSVVRWLHPALPVDVELDAGRVRRIAPVVRD
ncbi:hypothetical protein ACFZCK_23365 [Kitasatospora purpeofusca]|uniref:hypothetical protein n=1 Tax=Kitasatospora purpeofusca TaxID=67352 RepID=UPI0036E6FF14